MTSIQLRKKVQAIVEHADDRLLKMVYAMMSEYESTQNDFPKYEFSVEEEAEIYRRSKELKSGKVKGISHDELISSVRKRLKK